MFFIILCLEQFQKSLYKVNTIPAVGMEQIFGPISNSAYLAVEERTAEMTAPAP